MVKRRQGFFQKPRRRLYLGEWIDRLGYKRVEVAKAVGVTESYLSELIAGESKDNPKENPSSALMLEISEFLGISVNDLYHPPPPRIAVEAAERLEPTQIVALGRLLDEIGKPKRK